MYLSNPNPAQKPPFGSRIDWSNPIAEGLITCVILNEAEGRPIDLVSLELATANTMVWGAGGLVGDDASYAIFDTREAHQGLSEASVISKSTYYDTNDGAVFGISSENNTYRPAIGIVRLYAANDVLAYSLDSSGTEHYTFIAPSLNNDSVAMTWAAGGSQVAFLNGIEAGSIAAGPDLAVGTNPVFIGGYGGSVPTNRFINGLVEFGYIFNRVLSDDEIALLSDYPYCFIVWPSRRVIFDFGALGLTASAIDAVSVSEAVSAVAHYAASASDGFSGSDAVDPLASYVQSITDALNLSDLASVLGSATASASDTFSASDNVSPSAALLASIADSVTFSDSTTALLALIASTADTLSISSDAAAKAALVAILADNLDLSGIAEYAGSAVASVLDTLQVADSTGVIAALLASQSDGINLSDALIAGITAAASDSASFSDSASGLGNFIASLVSQLSFVDSADYSGGLSAAVSDVVSLSDAISAVAHFSVGISDQLSMQDSTSVLARYLTSVTDSLGLSDVVRIDSDLASGVVTITFGAKAPAITFKVRK